jgi:3,4-dihydroxy 2-butanone 4-phosphate synthase/GTP cyclohydrolase II
MANKLAQWLNADPKPMTKTAFAKRLEVTPGYVSQLCSDNPPWPGRDIVRKITSITKGAVTATDLANFPKAPAKPKREQPGAAA